MFLSVCHLFLLSSTLLLALPSLCLFLLLLCFFLQMIVSTVSILKSLCGKGAYCVGRNCFKTKGFCPLKGFQVSLKPSKMLQVRGTWLSFIVSILRFFFSIGNLLLTSVYYTAVCPLTELMAVTFMCDICI